jgi:hypothetical protein
MRPLAVRCGAFGDMVLMTALIRVLHARFRTPVDILTSGPWSEPLLRGQPGVGEILERAQPQDSLLAERGSAARGAAPARARRGPDLVLRRQRCGAAHCSSAREFPRIHRRRQGSSVAAGRARDRAMAPSRAIMPAARSPGGAAPVAEAPAGAARSRAAAEPGGCAQLGAALTDAELGGHAGLLSRRSATGSASISRVAAGASLASAPLILVQIGNKRTMRRGLRRWRSISKYWPNERWAEVLRHTPQNARSTRSCCWAPGPNMR